MTILQDEFDALLGGTWVKALAAGTSTDIDSSGEVLYSSGDGNYICGPVTSLSFASSAPISTDNPVEVTLSAAHGVASGEAVWVYISGVVDSGGGVDVNGTWQATSTGTYTLTLADADGAALDGTGGVWDASSGQLVLQDSIASTGQRAAAVLVFRAAATGNAGTVWCRHSPKVTPKAGYGARLLFDGSTRTLQILKKDVTTGADTVLTSADVSDLMATQSSTDLDVSQLVTISATDLSSDSDLSEPDSVLLRAWVNTDDPADIALEAIDASDIHRAAGGWAVEISGTPTSGTVDVDVDTWFGESGYTIPAFGARIERCRSLSELRTAVARYIGLSDSHDYTDAVLNDAINDAIVEINTELGDNALYLRRMKRMTLTVDSDELVTMPYDVERVEDIFDAQGKDAIDRGSWRWVVDDDDGRLRLAIDERPSSKVYLVRYFEHWEPLESDDDLCPIPKKWDEAVRAGAALRIAGEGERDMMHNKTLYARYKTSMERMQKAMSRQRRQSNARMHFAGSRRRGPRYGSWRQMRGPF